MGKVKNYAANNPTITISLKPHLADYCRYLFDETKDGALKLRRNKDLGKLISSLIQKSETPVQQSLSKNSVTFLLPITKNNHYALIHNFYYIDSWGEEKIQDYIEVEFKRTVRNLFEIGYQKKYNQKEITESILKGLNFKNNALNFDSIKKIDYRNREKKKLNIFLDLQCALY